MGCKQVIGSQISHETFYLKRTLYSFKHTIDSTSNCRYTHYLPRKCCSIKHLESTVVFFFGFINNLID